MAWEASATEGQGSFVIEAEHPSLPGHFPGAPVVPGVVVLDHVLALMGATREAPRALAWVKFARPLLPGQRAEVHWAPSGANLRFSVSHDGHEVVRGQVSGAMR